MKKYGFDCCDIIERGDRHLKIGLIDADLLDHGTRYPNLVLLKISGYCKHYGHEVRLIEDYSEIDPHNINCKYFDILAMSCVFSFTYTNMIKQNPFIEEMIDEGKIHIGGTGFPELSTQSFLEAEEEYNKLLKSKVSSQELAKIQYKANLPHSVEHFMPDYHLYDHFIELKTNGDPKLKKRNWDDYLSYSIGFTTRGCFRQCGFCVNQKLTHVIRWSPVEEFLSDEPGRKYINLWDDNIMGAPNSVFSKVMNDLIASGKPFQFRQGMDIRLMNDAKAELLNKVKYHGDFIYAFDHYRMDDPKEKRQVDDTIRGLQIWRRHCLKSTKLYVIVAYDSQDEKDIEGTFYRINILMHYGCLPYIMRYEKWKHSEYRSMYIQLARWCNQPGFFKKMSFRQFCVRNEEYHLGIQNEHPKGVYPSRLVLPEGMNKPKKYCACYQAMLDFENKNDVTREIAKKYFDLRFEDINPYKLERK
jgi:hypothetical protein